MKDCGLAWPILGSIFEMAKQKLKKHYYLHFLSLSTFKIHQSHTFLSLYNTYIHTYIHLWQEMRLLDAAALIPHLSFLSLIKICPPFFFLYSILQLSLFFSFSNFLESIYIYGQKFEMGFLVIFNQVKFV